MIYIFNFIILLACVLNNIPLFGQIDCGLLYQAFNSRQITAQFRIDDMDSTALLFDKKGLIGDCSLIPDLYKKLKISKDSIYNLNTEMYSSYKPKHLIILYDYLSKGKNHTLRFWRPYTGASISLTYRKQKGRYRLMKHSIGTF